MTMLKKIASTGYGVQAVLRFALSASFAQDTCCRCGNASYGQVLCRPCARWFMTHTLKTEDCCPYCGKPLLSEQNLCMECREKRVIVSADTVHALFTYRLWCKNLLFAWKTEGRRSAALLFARALFAALPEGCRTVVPVPPRPGKIKVRGWDQIDDLCRILSLVYGLRIVSVLERKSVVQQKKMDRTSRLEHSTASYAIKPALLKKKVRATEIPQEVVLLDDVITTGATVEACASLLKAYGIRKVHVLSLFIVD